MGYIEENLQPKEKLISVAKNAWWALIINVIAVIISTVVAVIGPKLLFKLLSGGTPLTWYEENELMKTLLPLSYALYVFVGVSALMLLKKLFYLLLNKFCLTETRLFGKKGFIKRETIDAPLTKIDSVSIKTTFWGRIFNFSSIVVKTTSDQFVFPYIAGVQQFKNEVMQQLEKQKENERIAQAKAMADAIKGAK